MFRFWLILRFSYGKSKVKRNEIKALRETVFFDDSTKSKRDDFNVILSRCITYIATRDHHSELKRVLF